jgi:type I restriction enzyme S subunit
MWTYTITYSYNQYFSTNRARNDNLEQQAQVLYRSWFVDFEPFKGGGFVDSELGKIPEGWRVGNIYENVDVIYGAPYKSSLFNDTGNGLPLIRIRDLKTFSPQFYTPEILPNTEFVEMGDVIAGMDAEFIPCLWFGEKGVLNQRCCKFIGREKTISNYYIMYLLKPELEFVQSYKTGTTVSHLGKSDIDRFTVINPPFSIITAFSKIVNSLLEEKIKLAQETLFISSLRDTLLPQLMSGELKTGDLHR